MDEQKKVLAVDEENKPATILEDETMAEETKKENSILNAPKGKVTLHQMKKFAQKLKRKSEWGTVRAKNMKEQRREEAKERRLARREKIKQGNLKHERMIKCQTK